jgi:hypothetical protein
LRNLLRLLQKALAAQLDNGEPENEYVKKMSNAVMLSNIKIKNRNIKDQTSNTKYPIKKKGPNAKCKRA